MRIIVTGASGMIGSELVKTAIEMDMSVIAIIRPGSKNRKNLPSSEKVTIIESDINDYEKITINEKCDILFHLSWSKTFGDGRDDVFTQVNNIKNTLDAVMLTKRTGANVFVGAGSQAEYGPTNEPLSEKTNINPQSGYGISKYASGKLSKLLCDQLNIRFNWARILSVYGINDSENTLISYVINSINNNINPELTKCEQLWDYIYCKDAAKALLLIGLKGVNGKIYPIGSGECKPLKEYVMDIKQLMNRDVTLLFGSKDYYPHQPMYLKADISELVEDTGFKPDYSFVEGIKEIIDYKMKHNGCG